MIDRVVSQAIRDNLKHDSTDDQLWVAITSQHVQEHVDPPTLQSVSSYWILSSADPAREACVRAACAAKVAKVRCLSIPRLVAAWMISEDESRYDIWCGGFTAVTPSRLRASAISVAKALLHEPETTYTAPI